eukprot:TRINITY_DN4030_c0_g1_i1.p1 TRINITY_DN4030_c0_g1~~TRINITY_DN4030_c0_g1_i1.p1  ORF type:complete len:202 (-),score=47.44 TRINITY_DN4030_c0_g1_i1:69-674(-)
MESDEDDIEQRCIRLILLGNSEAGKTSLLVRYTDGTFLGNFASTIGVDFRIKRIRAGGKDVRLEIWDTSGQERYRTVTKSYFSRAMGVVLVYDCANEQSFFDVRNWVKQLENHAREDIVMVLVGNKCDLVERRVNGDEGKKLADEFGMEFVETSAKLDINVDKAFRLAAEQIANRKTVVRLDRNVSTIASENTKPKNLSCC